MSLWGARILVPRGGDTGARWSAAIAARGGIPILLPLVETAPPLDPAPLAEAVAAWNRGDYHWVAVTSPRGARAFVTAGALPGAAVASAAPAAGAPEIASGTASGRVAAVGPATAAELAALGLTAAIVPPKDFSAAGLAEALLLAAPAGSRVLLPVSEVAGNELPAALGAAGMRPHRVTAYRTFPTPSDPPRERALVAGGVDAILVGSGSVARQLAARLAPLAQEIRVIAIGPPTARTLRSLGLAPDAVAAEHTLDGLLDAAAHLFAASGQTSDRRQDSRRPTPTQSEHHTHQEAGR